MRRWRRLRFLVTFLAPAVALYFAFVLWPLVQTLQLSLFRWRGVSGERRFVGFENYLSLLEDQAYHQTLANVGVMVFILVPILTVLGLVLAHLVEDRTFPSKLLRSVYLLPHITSVVAVGALWLFLYNPSIGLFRWGQPSSGWLGDPKTALGALLVAFSWYAAGFYGLLYGAGLKQIPEEVRESARLDGAGAWTAFAKVTWPMLWSIRKVATPYIVINCFSVFALVMILTGGGQPDRHTETPLTFLYERAFEQSEFGYATTMGAFNFLLTMLITLGLLTLFRRSPEASRG